jgi:hypothetical protein
MPHKQFPTKYIYWEKIENHEQLKAKYMPIIDEIENSTKFQNPFEYCELKRISYNNESVNSFISNEDMYEIMWKPMNNFIREINSVYCDKIDIKESTIRRYWFNTYDKGEFQEFHNHKDTPILHNGRYMYPSISGIYILNDKHEQSSIVFKNMSTEPVPFYKPFSEQILDTSDIQDIGEGTVLLFPFTMEHMVKKCVIPGRRTIAFNIFSNL